MKPTKVARPSGLHGTRCSRQIGLFVDLHGMPHLLPAQYWWHFEVAAMPPIQQPHNCASAVSAPKTRGQPHCLTSLLQQTHGQCCAASKLHVCKAARSDLGFAHMLCSSSVRVTSTLVLMRAMYSLLAQAVRQSTALDTVGQLASMGLSLMTAGSED